MAEYTVLVIEDEADIQELIRVNLAAEGYRVESASTGTRGLDKARQLIPDLILLDLMLPEVDGLEVCRRLRTDDRTKAIPIIMLTARAEDVDVVNRAGSRRR
jgi:DNA-binding response OmpR family regulator